MNPTTTRVPRHRADTLHTPNGPIARALLRAAGLTPRPSGRHLADPPAGMGVDDVDTDALCAEVRAELDTPINTKAVTA